MEVPVHVWRVGRDDESRYLLVLRDDHGTPLLMTIGPCEAVAIWNGLQRGATPRRDSPETHDLLCGMIATLGGKLVKVVVDDFWNDVYFAKLHIAFDSQVLAVDSRPSDAVAIALRVGAPLFVNDAVLEAANRPPQPEEPSPEDLDPWSEPDEP